MRFKHDVQYSFSWEMNGLLNLETDNVRGPAQVNVQFVGPEMISYVKH